VITGIAMVNTGIAMVNTGIAPPLQPGRRWSFGVTAGP